MILFCLSQLDVDSPSIPFIRRSPSSQNDLMDDENFIQWILSCIPSAIAFSKDLLSADLHSLELSDGWHLFYTNLNDSDYWCMMVNQSENVEIGKLFFRWLMAGLFKSLLRVDTAQIHKMASLLFDYASTLNLSIIPFIKLPLTFNRLFLRMRSIINQISDIMSVSYLVSFQDTQNQSKVLSTDIYSPHLIHLLLATIPDNSTPSTSSRDAIYDCPFQTLHWNSTWLTDPLHPTTKTSTEFNTTYHRVTWKLERLYLTFLVHHQMTAENTTETTFPILSLLIERCEMLKKDDGPLVQVYQDLMAFEQYSSGKLSSSATTNMTLIDAITGVQVGEMEPCIPKENLKMISATVNGSNRVFQHSAHGRSIHIQLDQ